MQAKKDNDELYEQKWEDSGTAGQNALLNAIDLPDDADDRVEKRPWQVTEEELRANPFNPTNSNDLAKAQATIDSTKSPNMAYTSFAADAGNISGSLLTQDRERWDPIEVDPQHFKNKLKNMSRMVRDYPELKGRIGNMTALPDFITVMAAGTTAGGKHKANLDYNSTIDSMSWWGRIKRSLLSFGNKKLGVTTQASLDYTGTHELGHVLNSLLLDPHDEEKADYDWSNNITADSIVDAALKKTMSAKEYKKLKRYKKDNKEKNRLKGQIDLKGSKLYKKGHTSRYGQTNAAEFFAEAFADVYSHGEKAKPVSIALVREYEARRKELPPNDPLNTAMIEYGDDNQDDDSSELDSELEEDSLSD